MKSDNDSPVNEEKNKKASNDIPPDANCWDCKYNDLSLSSATGPTFLGVCTWFEIHGKGMNKEIPSNVVDKGCQHFNRKTKLPKK